MITAVDGGWSALPLVPPPRHGWPRRQLAQKAASCSASPNSTCCFPLLKSSKHTNVGHCELETTLYDDLGINDLHCYGPEKSGK